MQHKQESRASKQNYAVPDSSNTTSYTQQDLRLQTSNNIVLERQDFKGPTLESRGCSSWKITIQQRSTREGREQGEAVTSQICNPVLLVKNCGPTKTFVTLWVLACVVCWIVEEKKRNKIIKLKWQVSP